MRILPQFIGILLLSPGLFFLNPASAQTTPPATVDEHYFFEFSSLPLHGDVVVSWFFLRGNSAWNGGDSLNLGLVDWPEWDLKQVPLTLPPVANQQAFVAVYDDDKKLVREIPLDKGFAPDTFRQGNEANVAFYQIRILVAKGRYSIASPLFPWPARRRLSSCEVPGFKDGQALEMASSAAFKLCLSTARAFFENAQPGKQKYLEIKAPMLKGRSNTQALRSLERELSALARKQGAIVLLQRAGGERLTVELGFTQYENLPKKENFQELWTDAEGVRLIPDKNNPRELLHKETKPNGAELQVYGFYSDVSKERSQTSPLLGNRRVHLQLVADARLPADSVVVRESRTPVIRTGLIGLLQPFDISASLAQNSLASGRGDKNAFLSMPTIDLSYFSALWATRFHAGLERGIVTVPSELEITELKLGATKRPWHPKLGLSAGYHQYGIAGQTSASRLGSVNALSVGANYSSRFEDWRSSAKLNFLFGSSQSLDSRVELTRLLNAQVHGAWYVGAFLGFTNYRGFVVNKLNQRELFTENRSQIGLSFGYAGGASDFPAGL